MRKGPARQAGPTVPHAIASGFTLIELLVVIAIISLLLAILLPSMGRAREQGKTAVCMSNLRSISQGTVMYMENDEQRVIPWYRFPAYGGSTSNPGGQYGVNLFTPWVFGGFTAPEPAEPGYTADSAAYPAEVRPLNHYIDPTAQGTQTEIDVYKCPSDRTYSTAIVGQHGRFAEDEHKSSWRANGTSYTLNTRFMQGYNQPSGNFGASDRVNEWGRMLAPHLQGGKASRFVMWCEQGFYSATYQAAPTLAQSRALPQRIGWHREFSKWTLGFADGHAAHGYFDTRLSEGTEWTIWEPR